MKTLDDWAEALANAVRDRALVVLVQAKSGLHKRHLLTALLQPYVFHVFLGVPMPDHVQETV